MRKVNFLSSSSSSTSSSSCKRSSLLPPKLEIGARSIIGYDARILQHGQRIVSYHIRYFTFYI